MSLESFFDHTCDIYHLESEDASPGFGLPSSPSFSYPDAPDEAAVPCHFAVKSATVTVTQTEPANELEAKIKLTLPRDTDIRLNDKIVWPETGTEYTAEFPRNVRGHHKFVYLKRTDAQQPL
jgi:hypothetical protein